MNYLADPGGHFASDTHRRVLGHLSYHTDTYGWTAQALLFRMGPDVGTTLTSVEEIQAVLDELEQDGHVQRVDTGAGQPVYRMTEDGFNTLTGPVANEPPEGASPQGPAMISQLGGATLIGPTAISPEDNDVPA